MSLLLLASLAFGGTREHAASFTALWKAGDRDAMYARLTPEFRAQFSRESFNMVGKLLELKRERVDASAYHAAAVTDSFIIDVTIHFGPDGAVSGLVLKPGDGSVAYPSPHGSASLPHAIRFPFAGGDTWTATGSHHRASRSQRHAYDLRVLRGGVSFSGDAKDNASYFCYGKPVLAPADAEVAAVSDGEADAVPGVEVFTLGNSVTLKLDNKTYLFVTHLQPGVLVKPGQRVLAGQPLGKVGNSGHSTEPHLHIEAFDGLPRETADAYPLHFNDVIHNGRAAARALAAYGDTLEAQ